MSDTVKSLRELLTGSSIVFIGISLELFISFVAKVIIAQTLGPTDYGVVTIGVTLLTALSLLASLGMGTTLGRYVPRFDDETDRRGVLVSGFQLVLPVAIIVAVSVYLAAGPLATRIFDDASAAPIIRVFAFAIPLATVLKLTVAALQGYRTATPKVVLQNVLLPVSRFAFVAVVILAGFRATGIAWAYAGAYAATAALSVWYLYRHTSLFDRTEGATAMHGELLRFSLPLLVSSGMFIIFNDTDSLLIAALDTSSSVGIYDTVYVVGTFLRLGLISFSFLFVPIISELHSNENYAEMERMYKLVTKWIFVGTFPVFAAVLLFPEQALRLTFGTQYLPGSTALAVLSIGFFVHVIAGLNINTLTAIGETKLIMYNNVFVALLNVVLNLVLIPRYSFVGAAAATTISFVALNVIASAELYVKTGISPFSRSLLRPGVITVGLAGALYWVSLQVTASTPLVVVVSVGYLVAYAAIILAFGGIDEEELTLLLQFEERFGVDLGPLKRLVRRFASAD